MTMDFTNEATTRIEFDTSAHCLGYREEVEGRYQTSMVRVELLAGLNGFFVDVHHASNLGAELKGIAFAYFNGRSVNTIYNNDPVGDN